MNKKALSGAQSPAQEQSPEATYENLDAQYRLIRAALLDAGLNLNDSMDALYRDWRRWREKAKSPGAYRDAIANADQWWARHLAQFRSLIDPLHIAARAERARKDDVADRAGRVEENDELGA